MLDQLPLSVYYVSGELQSSRGNGIGIGIVTVDPILIDRQRQGAKGRDGIGLDSVVFGMHLQGYACLGLLVTFTFTFTFTFHSLTEPQDSSFHYVSR